MARTSVAADPRGVTPAPRPAAICETLPREPSNRSRGRTVLLKRFYDDPLAQASFLVADTAAHEAIVVDPHRDAGFYLGAAAAEHLRIVGVTETHIHADYCSGTRELAQRAGATAYL